MNLIIMGTSRSGKTMLAREICLNFAGFSLINMDCLVMTFKKVFPNLQINYYDKEETIFSNFVEQYLDNCTYKSGGVNYIFEGNLPKELVKRLNKTDNYKVIYLGKPNILPQDFFDEIRKYEQNLPTGGWTKKLDNKTLLSWCNDWVTQSQKNQKFCEENNIDFFDTSINQMEVINNIIQKMKQNKSNPAN